MSGPLSGVKILDLTTVVMGPVATQILAELGADVIKVETHDGDNMRHVGPMTSPAMGHLYLNLNRGKRGIVLDLKQPAGRDAMLRMMRSADVLIYNVRPQAMARLGLAYEQVRAVNPRIIYVGAYGYSQRGPYAAKAAYDDLIQGATGLPALVARNAGDEAPRYAPVNLADRVTGLHAVYAVTTALYFRERSGEGQSVEVPMFESMAHFVLGDHLAGLSWEPPIGGSGYARLEHRRPYRTKDGWLCVLVYNDKQWKSFLQAVDRADLLQDPRFFPHASRATHIDEIYEILEEIMRTRSTADWMALLERIDIPVAPVNSVEDLVHDPHLAGSGFFSFEEHPSAGRLRVPRTPTEWSACDRQRLRPAPRLGQHSGEVLREAGYTDAEIEELVLTGVTLVAR
jgi:crotonobetainyl-CoA:carnitine CoA-transferase CaiB-like acyl-CoA transferase